MIYNSERLNYDFEKIFNLIGEKNWKNLKKSNILMTGCTGPFGFWILNSLIFVKKKTSLNFQVYVLTRKKNSNFIKYFNKNKFIKFIIGDIRTFKIPNIKIDYIIHGATTTAKETYLGQNSFEKYSVLVDGTRHLLKLIKNKKIKKLLFLSSGSVYGKCSKKISENFLEAYSTNNQNFEKVVLGEAKRSAEVLISSFGSIEKVKFNIARCFTFAGPYMPLDIHYAFGNFIKQAYQNKNIVIHGHIDTERSYLSFLDLSIAIWKIIFLGKDKEIYNVGSDKKVKILKLANLIKKISRNKKKIIIKKNKNIPRPDKYIPCTDKLKKDLNFSQKINLKNLIKQTLLEININKKFYFKK